VCLRILRSVSTTLNGSELRHSRRSRLSGDGNLGCEFRGWALLRDFHRGGQARPAGYRIDGHRSWVSLLPVMGITYGELDPEAASELMRRSIASSQATGSAAPLTVQKEKRVGPM
jgi:hypothetical protein